MYFYGYFGFRNPEKIQQKIIKRNGQIANFFNIKIINNIINFENDIIKSNSYLKRLQIIFGLLLIVSFIMTIFLIFRILK